MYDFPNSLPTVELDSGTNILVTGPPMTGKRRVAMRVLTHGANHGEGAIAVTNKDGAAKILRQLERQLADPDDANLGVVDCVTKRQGSTPDEPDPRVKYVSSPVDMTGIGISLSEFLEEFYTERGIDQNRILVHSLSPLLMYSNLETVFRFLHIFTGRVQSASALGIYVIDSDAHDDRTLSTLKQLFDGVIEVEDGPDGEPAVTLRGIRTE